jgi:myosin-1
LATVVEKKAAQLKVERKLSITMLTGVSLSNLQDDWMVIK